MRLPRPRHRGEALPPLHNGDRMARAEFHGRYLADPDELKIELIGGVVYWAPGLTEPRRWPSGPCWASTPPRPCRDSGSRTSPHSLPDGAEIARQVGVAI